MWYTEVKSREKTLQGVYEYIGVHSVYRVHKTFRGFLFTNHSLNERRLEVNKTISSE